VIIYYQLIKEQISMDQGTHISTWDCKNHIVVRSNRLKKNLYGIFFFCYSIDW